MFLGNEPSTTFTSPRPSLSNTDVLSGLLYGEFKFDRNLDTNNLLGLLGKNNYLSSEELQNIKYDIFSDASISPKFVYTHIGPGHAQLSGKCLPNETELFEHRLQKANYFMQQDVNAITSSNKNAIIIIAGDHGPYLTKNCRYFEGIPENEITARDIVDRLGMFMAIKWPQDYRETTKIETLQDAMPAVFSYMTNAKISNSDQEPVQKKSHLVDTLMIENGIIQYGKDKGKALYYWLDKK